MTRDLALIAERRAGLAALFGLLLLEEPGPDLRDFVSSVPALAPLASGDPAIATAYERIFLRGVPLFESVFRSDNGQQGGDVLAAVVARYETVGFREHSDRRWRVAGDDHLGMQLRCYAQLCHDEAAAWRNQTPDLAMKAVETERSFLADHLSTWAQIALDAVSEVAGGTPYCDLIHALDEFVTEEHDRLRPGPLHGQSIELSPLPSNFGPARLSRLLLTPATCGVWLTDATISQSARSIGSPWRPSDTRSALRHLVETANDSGDLDILLEPIHGAIACAAQTYAARAAQEPANEATWRMWQQTAETMAGFLATMIESNRLAPIEAIAQEAIMVTGADPTQLADVVDEIVERLRAKGFSAERIGGRAIA